MLPNALLVAWRHLRRRRSYTAINVGGLAVGLTACLLIGLYVYHELSVDAFHAKGDRIVRVTKDVRTDGETLRQVQTSGPEAPAIAAEFTSVERSVRFFVGSAALRKGDTFLDVEEAFFADSTLFDVFSFELAAGNPSTALSEPNQIVLTADLATTIFGNASPIGQTLESGTGRTLTVSGVMASIPSTSSIQGQAFLSMRTLEDIYPEQMQEWFLNGFTAFLLLKNGADADALEAQLSAFLERRVGDEMDELKIRSTLHLEPLASAYFSERGNPLGPSGSRANLWLFGGIALFILGIASVNFTNLATARAAERATEVGVRKAMGAAPTQLILRFLAESTLLSLAAVVLSAVLAVALLPGFNTLAGTTLSLDFVPVIPAIGTLVGLAVVATLLAGTYPVLVTTRFQPSQVLRSQRGTVGGSGSTRFRQSLIVVQFAVAIGLIAVTAIVFSQLDRLTNADLGFHTEQRLVLEGRTDSWSQNEAVKRQLASVPGVQAVSASAGVPGLNEGTWYTTIYDDGETMRSNIALYSVDYDFADVYGIEMVAGRAFDPARATDSTEALIINETAVDHFGFASAEEAVGSRFEQLGRTGTVIGVVEDIHFTSLRQSIQPMSLRILEGGSTTFTLQVDAGTSLPATLEQLEATWADVAPTQPFVSFFLDDRFDQMYRADRRFGRMFGVGSGLALALACLGLFGLVAVNVQQRRREIGLRKALGASVSSIVGLFSQEVLVLVGVALAIASPLAYLGATHWLNGFAVQVEIGPTWFVTSGLVVAVVAAGTASIHAVRAALANPADALQDAS